MRQHTGKEVLGGGLPRRTGDANDGKVLATALALSTDAARTDSAASAPMARTASSTTTAGYGRAVGVGHFTFGESQNGAAFERGIDEVVAVGVLAGFGHVQRAGLSLPGNQ